MSLRLHALRGIVWSALASWLQLLLGLATFFVVARYLTAVSFGIFGAAMLVISAGDTFLIPTLTQSIEQRETLKRDHINATMFYAILLSGLVALGAFLGARMLERAIGVEQGVPVLRWLLIGVPITVIGSVPTAMLARELRFGALARISSVASVVASIATLSTLMMDGGLWALVAGELASRAVRCGGAFALSAYRPGWPRKLNSFHDLARFNSAALGLAMLSYVDYAAPRVLTGRMLGAAELGYFVFAQRVYELLILMLLDPINRVVMTTIARLQRDTVAMRALVTTLYQVSTSIAYPGFLAAAVLAPDFVGLQGTQWLPATVTMQILLLVGIRTSTGMFNFGILRGLGRSRGPLLLLSFGLVMQLVLVPIGAQFSITGVALAVLARSIANWPVGCWLIKRATGLTLSEQIRPGGAAFAASLIMVAVMQSTLTFGLADQPSAVRIVVDICIGLVTYVLALIAISPRERHIVVSVGSAVRRGDRAKAIGQVRDYFGTLG